jgi:hypothetical protein
MRFRPAEAAWALAGLLAAAAAAAQPVQQIGGTWDLVWETRKGPSKKGYMAIEQKGDRLVARIHGQGSVTARGTIAGTGFRLGGSRMAIPYTISGRVEGGRMTGSLRMLSVTRRFTGVRRPAARPARPALQPPG